MAAWEQWLKRPQTIWLRKAIFQIHLWTGIGLGIYIIVVCLSGSAAVFNSELYSYFLPKPPTVAPTGPRLTRAQARSLAQQTYPGRAIARVSVSPDAREAAVASFGIGVNAEQRFFDPYTGKDLGNARPFGLRMVSWFSQIHMNLMLGYTGRLMNGVGGFLTAALTLTGLIVWWPGVQRWRRSLTVHFDTYPKRLNWDLHNAIGFWTFAIVFMWAVTGAYLVFPGPFENAIAFLAGHRVNIARTFHDVHVGNFADWPVKALWVVLGLAPPFLFVTGFLMWWNRVVRSWLARKPVAQAPRAPATSDTWPRLTVEQKPHTTL